MDTKKLPEEIIHVARSYRALQNRAIAVFASTEAPQITLKHLDACLNIRPPTYAMIFLFWPKCFSIADTRSGIFCSDRTIVSRSIVF